MIDLTQTPTHIEAQFTATPRLLVQFSSPTCSVCHAIHPRLDALAAAYNWPIVDINVDQHPEVAAQRLVFTVPTILVLVQGKEMLRESRFIDLSRLERLLSLMEDAPG